MTEGQDMPQDRGASVKGGSFNAFGDDPIALEPCKCGYAWAIDLLPESICHHASGGGEYIVICPRCGADGELKATPKWAVEAWNAKRSAKAVAAGAGDPTEWADSTAYEMREFYEANRPLRWWEKRNPPGSWGCIADNLMIGLLNIALSAERARHARTTLNRSKGS